MIRRTVGSRGSPKLSYSSSRPLVFALGTRARLVLERRDVSGRRDRGRRAVAHRRRDVVCELRPDIGHRPDPGDRGTHFAVGAEVGLGVMVVMLFRAVLGGW